MAVIIRKAASSLLLNFLAVLTVNKKPEKNKKSVTIIKPKTPIIAMLSINKIIIYEDKSSTLFLYEVNVKPVSFYLLQHPNYELLNIYNSATV